MRVEFTKKTDEYPVGRVIELRDDVAADHIKHGVARVAGRDEHHTHMKPPPVPPTPPVLPAPAAKTDPKKTPGPGD